MPVKCIPIFLFPPLHLFFHLVKKKVRPQVRLFVAGSPGHLQIISRYIIGAIKGAGLSLRLPWKSAHDNRKKKRSRPCWEDGQWNAAQSSFQLKRRSHCLSALCLFLCPTSRTKSRRWFYLFDMSRLLRAGPGGGGGGGRCRTELYTLRRLCRKVAIMEWHWHR